MDYIPLGCLRPDLWLVGYGLDVLSSAWIDKHGRTQLTPAACRIVAPNVDGLSSLPFPRHMPSWLQWVMDGRGWSWTVMDGHGISRLLYCLLLTIGLLLFPISKHHFLKGNHHLWAGWLMFPKKQWRSLIELNDGWPIFFLLSKPCCTAAWQSKHDNVQIGQERLGEDVAECRQVSFACNVELKQFEFATRNVGL